MTVRLKPSLMCMSPLHVQEDLNTLADHFTEVHVDVMDGHFVPSLHLSPSYVGSIRSVWTGTIEVHLMVTNPERLIADLQHCGSDAIVVHIESLGVGPFRALQQVRDIGSLPGVAITPAEPLSSIVHLLPVVDRVCVLGVDPGFVGSDLLPHIPDRVRELRRMRSEFGLTFEIEVDGGIRPHNIRELELSGADSVILGNAGLFDLSEDLREACEKSIAMFK